jgi:4'-phosphopantetheinyl transferase EntD
VLDGLFPEDVVTAWGDPLETSKPLYPEEEALVTRAVAKRRQEFAKGRECARAALSSFGRGDEVLLSGESREPLWPADFVGSITHTQGFCAAAVGRSERYLGIGIDAEPAEPLGPDVARRVCRDDELQSLSELHSLERAIAFRLLFSAKEAVYKCVYPFARVFLGFEDVAIGFGDGIFVARIVAARRPLPPDSHISGRWRRTGAHLVTAAWMNRGREPLP